MRFALRLVLVAVIGFTGGSLAPSNSLRRDVDPDGRQAVSELQSALTAAARGEPVTSTLFSLQWPPGERSDRSSASSAPVWSRTSIFSLAGLHGGLITDQRRVIRLTCRGARASHLTTEPPERPRLPS